jgi:hypothetical protein
MNLLRNRVLSFLTLSFTLGTSASVLVACDDGDNGLIGDLAEQCGLTCPTKGVAEGNASISGIVEIDAFFSGVVSLKNAAASTKADLELELRGLAADLGVTVAANASIDQMATDISAALQAKITANLEGGITVKAEPPKCEANIEVVAQATAECDVSVMPGSAKVECSGSCEIEASAAADCMAKGTLTCDVQMPGAACSGTCTGSCELTAMAECSGKCEGSCMGECSACLGGECKTEGGAITNCVGSCTGMCQGSCKLEAGGSCNGSCEGRCEYTPGGASCEANAEVKCQANAEASVECKGSCQGEVKPPSAKAECKAAVEAKASAEVVCTPPQLAIDFTFKASADASAKAEFRAAMNAFKVRFSAILAMKAKLEGIARAAGNLTTSGVAAVEASVTATKNAAASGDASLSVITGLGCALPEVQASGKLLTSVAADVNASVSGVAKLSTAVGTRYTH